MNNVELNQLNHFVLRKHHLTRNSQSDNVVQIVRDIFGLHATGATTPYLSLFSRMKNFTRDKLSNELSIKKTLARIRCVRKTIYIVPGDMVPTVFSATRKMVDIISERHYKYLGITEQQYEEFSKRIMEVIKGQGLTTKEIKQELDTTLNVSPIVNLMCDRGLLIRGLPKSGWKNNIHTYYPFREYFPDIDLNSIEEEKARELIVRQYLASFGPVTKHDISWWTGFPRSQIKTILKNLQDDFSNIEILDQSFCSFQIERAFLCSLTPFNN